MSLTRETLMKMNKDVLAGTVLDYKERFDSTLSAINDELKERKIDFRKLESDLAISSKRQRQTHQAAYFGRKNTLGKRAISGIPESIQDDDLDDCVLKIFNECDTPVDPQPTFQHRINVVSTLWINVANETKSDVAFSTLHNVDTMSVSDVETTLKQRCYNFISTLFQRDLNISKSCIKTSRASDKYGFANRKLSFILLNMFDNLLTVQLLIN